MAISLLPHQKTTKINNYSRIMHVLKEEKRVWATFKLEIGLKSPMRRCKESSFY